MSGVGARIAEGIYIGHVVHARVRPVAHRLRYSVFSILVDCHRLDELDRRVRLFSVNRWNLVSLFERDHGDGKRLRDHLAQLTLRMGPEAPRIERFMMLCYPRVLGYVFNPLTVFYGLDSEGVVRLTAYEVNNTFGERMTYVLPAAPGADGLIAQTCPKSLHVSPFNSATGRYGFRVTTPGEDITVGVSLRDEAGPVLKAHFRGRRYALTDATLIGALTRTGWMTAKVFAGIHLEAARLWLKGLRPLPRARARRRSVWVAGDTGSAAWRNG